MGPFSFRERTADIVLERSEHYYDADQVFLEELVFTPVEDSNVRVANLLSGELQIADRLASTDVDTVDEDDRAQVASAPELGYRGITTNIANADGVGEPPGEIDSPLSEPLVREAFELSLDRQAIADVVFDGQVVPGCRRSRSPIRSGRPNADASSSAAPSPARCSHRRAAHSEPDVHSPNRSASIANPNSATSPATASMPHAT